MGNIFTDLFSTDAADKAAAAKKAGYAGGLNAANGAIDQGLGAANGYYGQAQIPFLDLLKSTHAGSAAYGDATGANGAEGLARARALFEANPGYQSGLDMTLNQNDRRAAARGILASGNTIADTTKLATDYSNQHYGDYVGRLAPYLGAEQGAAAGNAGVLTQQAGTNFGAGAMKGKYGWDAYTGMGNADADADMASYDASKNFWGALMGGANMALKTTGWGGWGGSGKGK